MHCAQGDKRLVLFFQFFHLTHFWCLFHSCLISESPNILDLLIQGHFCRIKKYAQVATVDTDDPYAGPQAPSRSRGNRRPLAPRLSATSLGGAALARAAAQRRHRRRWSDPSPAPEADEHATNFVNLFFSYNLPVPQDNFIDFLQRASAYAPQFVDPVDLEECCSAVVWVDAFLESKSDPNEWGSLPDPMQQTLLGLHPMPRHSRSAPSSSHRGRRNAPPSTKWERLALDIP